jgi:argininosuccinate synthase
LQVRIGFEQGEAVALDGEAHGGPCHPATLNTLFARYGVGRGHVHRRHHDRAQGPHRFRGAGPDRACSRAHRALEEAVLTKQQNRFKPEVARKWVELVYEGFYHDPLKTDLEAFLASSQRCVNGEVVLETQGGSVVRSRAFAAHPQCEGCDLRAVGRLGRAGGRRLHPAVRHEFHAVGEVNRK